MTNEFSLQQLKAIETLDRSVVVWAGAGAGKTRVLVERFFRIIAMRKAQVKEILAITFTNKAAKEMRSRIRHKLQDKCSKVTGDELVFWRNMKEQLQWAPISTIHSLCMIILRDNPVEAVLDPKFNVLDEAEGNLLLRETVAEVLANAIIQQEAWAEKLLNLYGKASLLAMICEVYKKMEVVIDISPVMAAKLKEPYQHSQQKIKDVLNCLKTACTDLITCRQLLKKGSTQEDKVRNIEENWPEVCACIDRFDDVNYHTEFSTMVRKYFVPLEARSKDKEAVRQIRICLEELDALQADKVAVRVVEDVCTYIWQIKEALAKKKHARRALTFTDLEHKTVELLEKYPAVCQKFKQRYKFIMVDEFQDTNEIQKRIIYLLAGGNAGSLQSDSLFIVGDPKQSIYRFRGADVSVFYEVTNDILKRNNEPRIDLDVNYRSTEGILAVVNSLFQNVMGTENDEISYEQAKWYRLNEDEAAVRLLVVNKMELDGGKDIRQVEGEAIAAQIQELIKIGLASNGGIPVNYRDIAILFHSMTHVGHYETALRQAKIPYYVIGNQGFYDCLEIVDTINLLKVIENPHNQIALAGLLRSPYFMFSDRMLLVLASTGADLWQGLAKLQSADGLNPQEQNLYRHAYHTLQKLCSLRSSLTIEELLELAFEYTRYPEYLLSQCMGLQKYANIQKIIDVVREFQIDNNGGLGDFLRYIQILQREGDLAESEAQIDAESENTVKIMTIHKAKGLEFPVVIVPNLERNFLAPTAPVLYNAKLGLGLRIKDEKGEWKSPSFYRTVQEAERKATVLEMKRLLYVAMTRAENCLILSCSGDKVLSGKEPDDLYNSMSNWLKWLAGAFCFNELDTIPDLLCNSKISVHKPLTIVPKDNQQCWADRCRAGYRCEADEEIWTKISRNIKLIREQTPDRSDTFSPTALQSFRHCPRQYYYRYVQNMPEVERHENQGDKIYAAPAQLVGLVVHKVCEILADPLRLDEYIYQAVEQFVPAESRHVVTDKARILLQKYVVSEFYQELSTRNSLKEVRFTYNLVNDNEEYKMSGIIDCLQFYEDGSIGIIDYKTDQVDSAQAKIKAQEYSWQMAIYSWAATAVYRRPVRDAKIYFIQADAVIDMEISQAGQNQCRQNIISACRYIINNSDEEKYSCNLNWCAYCSYTYCCPDAGQTYFIK